MRLVKESASFDASYSTLMWFSKCEDFSKVHHTLGEIQSPSVAAHASNPASAFVWPTPAARYKNDRDFRYEHR
jgi:hypothetical protein